MQLNGIGGSSGLLAGTDSASERADLNREQFMEILITELTNQDPLEPLKNEDFLNQLVNMQNLEATAALTDGIKAMQDSQQLVTSSALIGKSISAVREDGTVVAGTVDSVSMRGGKAYLNVGAQGVSINEVREVTAPATE